MQDTTERKKKEEKTNKNKNKKTLLFAKDGALVPPKFHQQIGSGLIKQDKRRVPILILILHL